MSIAPLPQNTIRAIGSTSALSDPCSVIKELLDNALDASATSISVEVSSNTLDIIQLKDNGSGILPADREFVCRPNFTSKIQTLEDLANVGGKSLGFRGAALAGVAEMSSEVMVTTRVDGEVVAAAMKYGRDGEILSKVKASHTRGTTVRVSNFLNNIPVRKQVAVKMSSKTITNIKKMLQAYAIARPTVRLSIKVLKAKGDGGNWVYGPTPKATISEAAFKIAGSDVASQCNLRTWPVDDAVEKGPDLETTSTEGGHTSNFKLVAYLPNPGADFHKTSRVGQYIAIDGRPVSVSKGVPKDIIKSFKLHIRSLWAREGIEAMFSETFLCLHIYCPRGGYDVNIEPSKDEVLFENTSGILYSAESLFSDVYGEITDYKPERGNGKQRENNQPLGNAFDVLLATKATNSKSTPGRRRPSCDDSRTVVHEEPTPHRYSQHSITDLTKMASKDASMPSTPWTMPKSTIKAPTTSENSGPNRPLRRLQQLLTPARERRSSPIRNLPTRESYRPSSLPSPIHTQQPRAESSSPEATPVAAKNNTSLKNLDGSTKSNIVHQTPNLSSKGYGDDAIATWVRESRLHIDDCLTLDGQDLDDSEVAFEPAPLEPQGDASHLSDKACREPTIDGGLRKPFRLPPKLPQKAQQRSGVAIERGDTLAAMRNSEGHSITDDGSSGLEYPGTERVPTLIRDPSKEAFNARFEATLDYERRKKTLSEQKRNQPRSQSTLCFPNGDPTQDSVMVFPPEPNKLPHKNRYHAAKAALAPREPVHKREQGGEEHEAQSTTLESEDPRAYYIWNREKIEGSTDTKSGLKVRRIQTHRLPLERIPGKCSLHHLISTCSMDHELISSLVDDIRKVDTYIGSGNITSSSHSTFTELCQKESSDLRFQIRNLVRQEYKTEDGSTPADIPLDFKNL